MEDDDKITDEPVRRPREAIGDPDAAGDDFAGEHDDTTVGEDPEAGDDAVESESPRGLGGMDLD